MAATATQQVIANGSRNLVLKYTIGGTTGDTTAGTLVDISALDATLPTDGLRLERAQWSLTGFTVKLLWDATADVDLVEMGNSDDFDFSQEGGIVNNAGSGVTGDVNFTTTGYTAAGDGGSFVLHFKKRKGVT